MAAEGVLTLAFETSGGVGSAALRLEDGTFLERVFPEGTTHGKGLLPACDELLREAGRAVAEVSLIAVSLGPGSFTGLRVGVSAAKGMAFALGADLVGVSTLDVLARNAPDDAPGTIVPVLDARRGHVHAALYSREGNAIIRRSEDLVFPPDRLTERLEPPCTILGDGVRRYPGLAADGCRVLPEEAWRARATVVARLAARDHAAGRRDPVHEIEPLYNRISTPEERRAERERGGPEG
jgi:tRNA threonylcarbamoyladenosine biosynthesis protein TsaB